MNNNDSLIHEVTCWLGKILHKEVDPTKPEALLIEYYGADSMDMVDIADTMETKYGIVVTDEQVPNIRTVEDILRLIQAPQGIKENESDR